MSEFISVVPVLLLADLVVQGNGVFHITDNQVKFIKTGNTQHHDIIMKRKFHCASAHSETSSKQSSDWVVGVNVSDARGDCMQATCCRSWNEMLWFLMLYLENWDKPNESWDKATGAAHGYWQITGRKWLNRQCLLHLWKFSMKAWLKRRDWIYQEQTSKNRQNVVLHVYWYCVSTSKVPYSHISFCFIFIPCLNWTIQDL